MLLNIGTVAQNLMLRQCSQRFTRICVAEKQVVSHPGEQAMIYADQTAAKLIPSP